VAVDNPGLPSDLGRDPASDQGDDRERAGRDERAVEPGRLGQPPPPHEDDQVDGGDAGQQEADPDHRLEGDPDNVHGRTLVGRNLLEPLDAGARVVEGEQGEQTRQRHAVADLVTVVPAAEVDGRTRLRPEEALEGGELRRLLARDRAGRPVADDDLYRCRERGNGQRHDERDPLVSTPAAL
jgi:hypothetical protein